MNERSDSGGPLRTEAPHVRLAGLRLKQLAREIGDTLGQSPSETVVSTQAFSTTLTFAAGQIHKTLLRLAGDVQRLSRDILMCADAIKVTDVDRACGELRLRVREVFALRNACHAQRFADWEAPFVADAQARIAACLRDFGRYCSQVGLMVLHPERMQADGAAELGVSLDLDLGRHLAVIAGRARRPVPVWRFT